METWLALAGGIALIVVIEVVAVRLYRRYRSSRQEPLARPGAEESAAEVRRAQQRMAAAEAALRQCLGAAGPEATEDAEVLVQGMADGAALQSQRLAALLDDAGLPAAEEARAQDGADPLIGGLREAMGAYAEQAATWAFDVAPEAAARAKGCRCRDAAKALRIAGEVSSCHAEVAEALASGSEDTVHEVSLCPTCGFMAFGRRPAFCVACGQPGFEMRALRRGILD